MDTNIPEENNACSHQYVANLKRQSVATVRSIYCSISLALDCCSGGIIHRRRLAHIGYLTDILTTTSVPKDISEIQTVTYGTKNR